MKKGIIVSLFLIAVLVVPVMFTSCNKATGGGSFTAEEPSCVNVGTLSAPSLVSLVGDFCTFGFNARPIQLNRYPRKRIIQFLGSYY